MKQGVRTAIIFKERQEWLFSKLPTDIGVAIVEHGEEHGRRVLNVIPFSEPHRITNRNMAAIHRLHTLWMGMDALPVAGHAEQQGRCNTCAAPNINTPR